VSSLPLTALKGVGPQLAAKLAKCELHSIQDLLFHLPYRYQDRTRVTPINNLRQNDYAVIEGEIVQNHVNQGRKRSLVVQLHDGHGAIEIRFFHFNEAQRQQLTKGKRMRCFGEVRAGYRQLSMIHPEYQLVREGVVTPVEEHLTPIYPSTAGLSQTRLRSLVTQALTWLDRGGILADYLPEEVLDETFAISLSDAIHFVHQPPPDACVSQLLAREHPAQQRLSLEELIAHQCAMLRFRNQIKSMRAPRFDKPNTLGEQLINALPFSLTNAQTRVVDEIITDLVNDQPMLRLVQGDVGAGKTVVAALAACQALASGYQVAVMAPTEILAEQHFKNFSTWFESLGIQVGWLAGSLGRKEKRETLTSLSDGTIKLIVGTHALFQASVQFANLGLVIIDEQHRFGVMQRLSLRDKGQEGLCPHQLIMTATPIPRSLSMTAYADLDLSTIDELPPGRTPIKTIALTHEQRPSLIERIRSRVNQGEQVYWICTLITESETLQCQTAENTKQLLGDALPDLKIDMVHGQLPAEEKDSIMQRFKSGDIDILVATTVVEVGVDVPNATLMVIEDANRLGLSQLHQLRGRVGRGAKQSFCVLLYRPPLNDTAHKRIDVLRKTNDGFEIAKKDLALRGPGELMGTRQTGVASWRIADFWRDRDLIPKARAIAKQLMHDHPQMFDPLIKRWLGTAEKFAGV